MTESIQNYAVNEEDPNAIITRPVTFQIGGYTNLVQAQREAADFGRPDVFILRSGIFPNPMNFKLKIAPISSAAYQWPDELKVNPFNQYYVDLQLRVTGTRVHIEDWIKKVNARIDIMHPAYTRTPENMTNRAVHRHNTQLNVDKASN